MRPSFRERVAAFFIGRNGPDALSRLFLLLSLVPTVVSWFVQSAAVGLGLYCLALVLMGYAVFRIFSRNLWKRQKENAAFVRALQFRKTRFAQRKTHRFFRCPRCKAWLRVPKGRGHIVLTCRPCGYRFERKS